jgi:hypothetical protein
VVHIHLRRHHLKMAIRPACTAVIVVVLHSTHALEMVLFADALYWFHHHVKEAVQAAPVAVKKIHVKRR